MNSEENSYQTREMDEKLPPFKLNRYIDHSITFDSVGGLDKQKKSL